MKITPMPGYLVVRLVKPKDVKRATRLHIPGHGDITQSQAGFKTYGRVQAVNWGEEEFKRLTRFSEGDIVAFQRGVLNPVKLRDPTKPFETPPDIVLEVDQVVAVLTDMDFGFEEGI